MSFYISTTEVMIDDPDGAGIAPPGAANNGVHNNLHPKIDFPPDFRIDFTTPIQYKQLTNGVTYVTGTLGVGYDYGVGQPDGQTTIYLLDRNGAIINPGAFSSIDWANGAEPNFNSYNYWQIILTHRSSGYSAPVFRWHGSAVGFTN